MIRLTNVIRREDVSAMERVKEIVSLAYIKNTENWKFSLHEHSDYCELIYIASGEGEYTVDNRDYQVKEGTIVLVNQKVGHVQKSNPDNPMVIWNISMRLKATKELGENILLPEGYKPVFDTGKWKSACEYCCQELYQEMKEQEQYNTVLALGLVERYLLLMQRALQCNGEFLEVKTGNIAAAAKKYIDENYSEKITLDFLAEKFHCSKYHLAHQMKKYYQTSPINYLIDRRIGEAQNLLCTTRIPINKVAEMVGYDNANYFNHLFNRKLGMSPQQFREGYENLV